MNEDTTAQAVRDLESAVRRLRDKVYGVPTSDKNWNACKEQWMTHENVKWLEEQVAKQKPL